MRYLFSLGVLLSFVIGNAEISLAAECAWPSITRKHTRNIAFPDTGSVYWSHVYILGEGDSIQVEGAYPNARYFSLNTYSPRGENLDGIADFEIRRNGRERDETEAGAQEGTWRVTVGAGDGQLEGGRAGVLIYRLYLPDGAVPTETYPPLPKLTLMRGGESTVLEPCDDRSGSILGEMVIRLFGPQPTLSPLRGPVFIRPESAEGFFPNRDNKYLAALVRWRPERVVVVRAKAPSTAGTARSHDLQADMRYWSICSNVYRLPYPVTACAHDDQIPLDEHGYFTAVMSTEADRPANATKEQGVTWLQWDETEQPGLLILRHMLPAPDFRYAVQRVEPGKRGDDIMGQYYPYAIYCRKDVFESGGWRACLPPR